MILEFSQLSRHFPEKSFQAPKIPQADWPGGVVIWAPFERQKIGVHIFERANLSGFGSWKFTAKEDLNRRKQIFHLLWPLTSEV